MIRHVVLAAALFLACNVTPDGPKIPASFVVVDQVGEVRIFSPAPGVTCFVLHEGYSAALSCVRDAR